MDDSPQGTTPEEPVESPPTDFEALATSALAEANVEPSSPGDTSTEAAPPSTEAQPGDAFDLFGFANSEFGVDLRTKYKDEREAVKGLLHAQQLLGRRDEEAQLGRLLKQDPQQVYKYLAGKYQPAPPTQDSGTPEWNPKWRDAIQFDEQGQPTGVKPGHPPDILHKYTRALEYAQERQQDLLFRPDKALEPVLKTHIESLRNELLQTVQQTLAQQSQQSQEYQQSLSYLASKPEYFADPNDWSKGLSRSGQQFNSFLQEGVQLGIPENNTQALVHYAQAKMQALAVQQKPLTAAAAQHRPNTSSAPQSSNDALIKPGEDLVAALRRQLGMAA